jgi:hypothetical protein
MDLSVTISIPDDLANLDSEKVSREVFEKVVAEAYRSGQIGPVQVRKLLGFADRFETEDFLRRMRAMDFTVEDYEHDVETLKRLGL